MASCLPPCRSCILDTDWDQFAKVSQPQPPRSWSLRLPPPRPALSYPPQRPFDAPHSSTLLPTKGNTTLSTPHPPSADQLSAARLAHWRQNAAAGADGSAVALLTVESARHFVDSCGLLLFAPRPQLINSPAPSLVEATLGAPNSAPTLADSAEARALLARLIAGGSAVPLNLLGAPSTTPDAPDFIASAATFPYIFTLRGDKAFKQPPSTSGATKVSPLALNTYTLLVENGPTSAYDLATQLGKEVTEAAVLRSLNELWQNLRVLPVPSADGGATVWETVINRFTKQLKAGANAGQPTALSALISLYLSQALLATETEIETFLSPLAPRSRVRDVLHALTGARQLETIAVDGKTHLHIHGDLPTFMNQEVDAPDSQQAGESGDPVVELAEDGTRIKKFIPKPRKVGTGYIERAKPFSSTGRPSRESRPSDRTSSPRGGESRPSSRPAGRFAGKSTGRPDRSTGPARPAFNKPWEEEKIERAARGATDASAGSSEQQPFQDVDLDAAAAPPPAATRAFTDSRPAKRPFAAKASSDRPAFPRKPGFGGERPAYSRGREGAAEGRPPRQESGSREGADTRPPRRDFSGTARPSFGDRKPFSKPGFEDRKRESPDRSSGSRPQFGERPPFAEKERRSFRRDAPAAEGRPPRREFAPRAAGVGRPPRREFTSRPDGEGRPPRREFAPRAGGEGRPPRRDFNSLDESAGRPPRESFSKPRVFRDRQDGEAGSAAGRSERPAFRKFDAPRDPRKPFTPGDGGASGPPRRDFAGPGKPPFSPRKPFVRSGSDAASGGREGGFAGKRDGGGYAGKKPFVAKSAGFSGGKPSSGRPASRGADAPGASTFDKFKGGNKPWGKRPPGRKPKPDEGKA